MTVDIEFPKDDETEADLREVRHIDLVYMRFDLLVDGESVVSPLIWEDYYADFFYMLMKVLLQSLPKLYNGQSGQFEFEGPINLQFEPDNTTVMLYLSSDRANVPDDRYEMDLRVFAREVIETSEEFLDFALEVRPDERGKWPVEEFEESLREAKIWYREAYGEDV